MLPKGQLKVIWFSALFAPAAMTLAALWATSAQAANGPRWLVSPVGGTARVLALSTEKVEIVSESEGAVTLLAPGLANVACATLLNKGELIGGEPGTDLEELEFVNCAVEGKTVTECAGTSEGMTLGVVLSNVLSALAYPLLEGSESELNEANALDMVFPDGSTDGETFVTFTLEGTNCGLLNKQKVIVLAKGTLIELAKGESFAAHCGETGWLGKLSGGVFARTAADELLTDGVTEFPGPTDGWLYSTTTDSPENLEFRIAECKLEVTDGLAKVAGSEDGLVLAEGLEAGALIELGWTK